MSSGNKLDTIALRFRSGLVDLVEQNRRHSRATLRLLRLKIGQKWLEDGMRDVQVIYGRLLSLFFITMLLKIAALANNRVEKINWPDMKLQMPRTNIRPIITSLFKSFIVFISISILKSFLPACFAVGIFLVDR